MQTLSWQNNEKLSFRPIWWFELTFLVNMIMYVIYMIVIHDTHTLSLSLSLCVPLLFTRYINIFLCLWLFFDTILISPIFGVGLPVYFSSQSPFLRERCHQWSPTKGVYSFSKNELGFYVFAQTWDLLF